MAAATSPATGEAYGVKRVCTIWGVARSSFYDARRQEVQPPERPAGRRGPKPALGDEDLLAAIRRDLARSPWAGEGHRKVWARLRVIDGIRVGRTRVLRSMGENGLLSPHRRPPGPANDHDGAITTAAPNVMWGADGAVIPDGRGRQRHPVHRRRALERRVSAGTSPGKATVMPPPRHWHWPSAGSSAPSTPLPRVGAVAPKKGAFMSRHFQNQLTFFGVAPSFAFVREPETKRRRRALHPAR